MQEYRLELYGRGVRVAKSVEPCHRACFALYGIHPLRIAWPMEWNGNQITAIIQPRVERTHNRALLQAYVVCPSLSVRTRWDCKPVVCKRLHRPSPGLDCEHSAVRIYCESIHHRHLLTAERIIQDHIHRSAHAHRRSPPHLHISIKECLAE